MNATEAKCLFFSCAGVLILLAYCIQLLDDARWKQYRQEHQCTVTDSRESEPGLIFTRPAQRPGHATMALSTGKNSTLTVTDFCTENNQ